MTRNKLAAWVLNLDAEYELASPDAHTPSARTTSRLPELVRALAPLLSPGDVVLGDRDALATIAGVGSCVGRAWCPTPRALERLAQAGATPLPAPPFSVLRRVNHRRFSAELGQTLPGAAFVTTMSDLRSVLQRPTPAGHWLVKRPFGFAGRGRRRVAAGDLEPSAATWVEASLRGGEGLQVEPWVERVADYGWHGFIAEDRAVTLGEATRQMCDESGAWKATVIATDLGEDERRALLVSVRAAADAMIDAGYFGPFGIDAYRWRDGATAHFNPRSEINARYSMGWATGMRSCRVDLL